MSIEFRLPNIDDNLSTEQKLEQLQSFLYQLVQKLNWAFNTTDLEKSSIESETEKSLLEFKSELDDQEGNISVIRQTAAGITMQVESNTGAISTLNQTAYSLSTRLSTAEGNVSTLEQTANSLSSRVTTAEGNASTAMQTANGIYTEVYDYYGNSRITQNANAITYKVSKGNVISEINQSAESVKIKADKINLNGYVTVTGLSNGTTTINGNCITTGAINASSVKINNLLQLGNCDQYGNLISGLYVSGGDLYLTNSAAQFDMRVISPGNLGVVIGDSSLGINLVGVPVQVNGSNIATQDWVTANFSKK